MFSFVFSQLLLSEKHIQNHCPSTSSFGSFFLFVRASQDAGHHAGRGDHRGGGAFLVSAENADGQGDAGLFG